MLQDGGQSQWLWPQEVVGTGTRFCGRSFDQHRLCGSIREAAEERWVFDRWCLSGVVMFLRGISLARPSPPSLGV